MTHLGCKVSTHLHGSALAHNGPEEIRVTDLLPQIASWSTDATDDVVQVIPIVDTVCVRAFQHIFYTHTHTHIYIYIYIYICKYA